MLQTVGLLFVKCITFLLFCAIGIKVGLEGFSVLRETQYSVKLVQWQLLDSQQKFQHMLNVNWTEVWAQAENGKYYFYQYQNCQGATCDEWIESELPANLDLGKQSIINSGCEKSYRYYARDFSSVEPRYPPQNLGHPFECAVIIERNPYNGAETLTYFVLLDNGNIWKWRHKPDLLTEVALLFACAFAGLSAGIVIWFPLQKRLL